MNNVLGIIAEYNPFHNGHKFHLEEAKRKANADYVVCVMSGNFTQRGDTSVIDKWEKTKLAIENGIDLVIELPVIYSISSAENFAQGAIKILKQIEINKIAFGAETDDLEKLNSISKIFNEEPEEYKNILSEELKKGNSFPVARLNAINIYTGKDYSDILNDSNNILAVEYLKAIDKYGLKVDPIVIKRNKVNYMQEETKEEFASATAIRKMIEENNIEQIKEYVPENTYLKLKELFESGNVIKNINDFKKEIIYKLRSMDKNQIEQLPDVSEGLENLIISAVNKHNKLELIINEIKSKRYTITRIQRIFLYALLGITKEDMYESKKINPYIRVLGFNKKGKDLISNVINNNAEVKVITSVKRFLENEEDDRLREMLNKDIYASNIYTIEFTSDETSNLDYTKKLIVY